MKEVKLTPREIEILKLLAMGEETKAIASDFHLSVKTIQSHMLNIKHKTGLLNLAQLTHFALEHGIITQTHAETSP